jgi:acetyl esterase/lipase
MKKILLMLLPVYLLQLPLQAQKIINLYDGVAPGSENWTWQQKETNKMPFGFRIRYNVTKPFMEVFYPDSSNNNHSAIMICPGGNTRVLNIEHEGSKVAAKLSKYGFTVFVLSYRLHQSFTDDPWNEMMEKMKESQKNTPENLSISKLARNDAVEGMRHIRKNAAAYNIDSNMVGCVGFSAGGALALYLSTYENPGSRPDFVALIYSGYKADSNRVFKNAPTAFIAAASDDVLAPPSNSVNIYNEWIGASRPAELHLYRQGGHGLRIYPGSTWFDRFKDWALEAINAPVNKN